MDIFPIASSSEGNVTWIKTTQTSILIDCGVTLKKVGSTIGDASLDAIFLTHEHSDHIKGAGPVARKYHIPVYIHQYSYTSKQRLFNDCDINYLNPSIPVIIGDLTITPFSTKHDCMYSFGFVIEEKDGPILCYLTDTGMVTKLMMEKIKKCDTFFIEADYDEEELAKYAGYPDELKERIASNVGHLSNQQTIELLKTLDIDKIKKIIIGHLSPRTNSPATINKLLVKNFPDYLDKFELAPLTKAITII